MGRWLDRLRKVPEGIPTKPTKPGSVSFVSTPSGHFQKKAPVELVAVAANDPQSSAWLHLLALADGRVIQRAGNLSTARVEEEARLQYGDDLLAVVAAPGFERPLTEAEIVKALAGGTLAAPEPQPASSSAWPEPPQVNTVNTPTREQPGKQAYILTAATASPDWLLARDQYMGHLMTCATCYAPTGRYCATGADLRQQYQFTPMEPTP